MISVISFGIMDAAIILFFIGVNPSTGQVAPMLATTIEGAVDPVPHALVLTSIVIGVSIKAIILSMILSYYRVHGTLDWMEAKKIRDQEMLYEG